MKLKYFTIVLSLVLWSCMYAPPEPEVWMEKGASLAQYKAFEVLPAQDDTGKTFDFDVGATLTAKLIGRLRAKGYSVQQAASPEEDILQLRSKVVVLEEGSLIAIFAEAAYCTVRTALVDNRTGRLLGEMVTSKEFRTGGLLVEGGAGAIGLAGTGPLLLDLIAEGIVNELEERIK